MGLRRVIVGFAFLVLPAPYPVDADPSRERLSQAIDAVVATPALAHASAARTGPATAQTHSGRSPPPTPCRANRKSRLP